MRIISRWIFCSHSLFTISWRNWSTIAVWFILDRLTSCPVLLITRTFLTTSRCLQGAHHQLSVDGFLQICDSFRLSNLRHLLLSLKNPPKFRKIKYSKELSSCSSRLKLEQELLGDLFDGSQHQRLMFHHQVDIQTIHLHEVHVRKFIDVLRNEITFRLRLIPQFLFSLLDSSMFRVHRSEKKEKRKSRRWKKWTPASNAYKK